MTSYSTTPCWEVLKFNFNSPQQSEDWRAFYTRAIDYLEALNINAKEADDNKTGGKHLKMMFEGKDRWIFIDSGTITLESHNPISARHHHNHHQVWRPLLALPKWTTLRCVPAPQWGHPCPKHPNNNPCQPVYETKEMLKKYGPSAHSEVPHSLGLDLASRPVPAELQDPSLPLPAAWI